MPHRRRTCVGAWDPLSCNRPPRLSDSDSAHKCKALKSFGFVTGTGSAHAILLAHGFNVVSVDNHPWWKPTRNSVRFLIWDYSADYVPGEIRHQLSWSTRMSVFHREPIRRDATQISRPHDPLSALVKSRRCFISFHFIPFHLNCRQKSLLDA